jgi:hypothetical protein
MELDACTSSDALLMNIFQRPRHPLQVLPLSLLLLDTPFLPQFFQLIKTGSAFWDVREQVGELSVRRPLREVQQDFASWTTDALTIRKVFAQDRVKCVEQFFFRIQSATPGAIMESKPICHVAQSRIPRSMIAVDENRCGIRLPALRRDIVCDVSTVRLGLAALGATVYARANTVLNKTFVTT